MAFPLPHPVFEQIDAAATGPILLSVPHAGRAYTDEQLALLRAPAEKLIALEDRHVDAVARGVSGVPMVIAQSPRAWIDLNRHEAEIDPAMVEEMAASRLLMTPKVRGGLGVVPRRLAGVGELWRGRLKASDVERRIATVHRPYHAALSALIESALIAHGSAVLIDLHSMPPLAPQNGTAGAQIVLGDRFGQTAVPWVSGCVRTVCARFGLSYRENTPYAGGHIIERHGRPASGVYAFQLELDRSLYLDSRLHSLDPAGLERTRGFLAAVIDELRSAAVAAAFQQAAE